MNLIGKKLKTDHNISWLTKNEYEDYVEKNKKEIKIDIFEIESRSKRRLISSQIGPIVQSLIEAICLLVKSGLYPRRGIKIIINQEGGEEIFFAKDVESLAMEIYKKYPEANLPLVHLGCGLGFSRPIST